MSRLRSAMQKRKRVALDKTESSSAKPLGKRANATVKQEPDETAASTYHSFHDPADITLFRTRILYWYDQGKRELPWRTVALTEPDINIRTYAVWVSEIMLQQTQVATVIDYYNKWMKRWPTVQGLAAATLEEVNQMWAGLGYYSRGKRLQEGAQKVVAELGGEMPRTVEALLKQLPGVGRYTAAAVGSIALGQVTGAVDGNVIRVLCRVRAIGADSTSPAVTEALWSTANTLVSQERPGDFNQAMMELGARVCTPKGPQCHQCPIQTLCHSYRKVSVKREENSTKLLGKLNRVPASLPDVEDCVTSGTCNLCPTEPWDSQLGVLNFPRKPVKKAPRVERTLTCVASRPGAGGDVEYLLTQRPSKGLLAGMWEFPSLLLEGENSEMKQRGALCAGVERLLGVRLDNGLLQYVGEVVHIFSHIHQTYVVYSLCLNVSGEGGKAQSTTRWLTRPSLQEAAVSTGVKKIMKLYDTMEDQEGQATKKATKSHGQHKSKKLKDNATNSGTRQLSLSSFFKSPKQET
ncbi:adenine DNA glycosylase isoform X2 [Oncorhynchus kisutch]|uniref:adenine DNA glycosylase isoform X2 n=1 Tax=Oncorhynchus kisutch TaxID=8019 RepID=UPI0012DE18DE|nr:adenine DNA glycosylase isoform X2 [Oncorhynchus kisutch]